MRSITESCFSFTAAISVCDIDNLQKIFAGMFSELVTELVILENAGNVRQTDAFDTVCNQAMHNSSYSVEVAYKLRLRQSERK